LNDIQPNKLTNRTWDFLSPSLKPVKVFQKNNFGENIIDSRIICQNVLYWRLTETGNQPEMVQTMSIMVFPGTGVKAATLLLKGMLFRV